MKKHREDFTILDWVCCVAGIFLSLFFASILLSGWPNGLHPNLTVPYIYSGDGLFTSWAVQRVVEGWLYENSRSGYPFGSDFYDFPGSDVGSLLIFKLLSLINGDWAYVLNTYLLISFPLVFISSYIVIRLFGVDKTFSFSGALLFTFIPFHIQRFVHTFYTWYFLVPVFFYLAFRLFHGNKLLPIFRKKSLALIFTFPLLITLSFFGVYYALFGVIVIVVGALSGYFYQSNFDVIKRGFLVITIISCGVLMNVMPNKLFTHLNGTNPEVAHRLVAESEIYALKIRQLVLPRIDSQIKVFSSVTKKYTYGALPGYYEYSAYLGLVGAIGFLWLGLIILKSVLGVYVDPRLRFLALTTWILALFGTIGGFGALFAGLISPMIRCWDRISIFVGFGAIASAVLILSDGCDKTKNKKIGKYFPYLFLIFALVLIFVDQNVRPSKSANQELIKNFETDKDFIRAAESHYEEGAAIYQLPYFGFPELAPLVKLDPYGHAIPFLHSKKLKWSWGGTRGRPGDLFYRSLSNESVEKQVDVIRKLGFSGIYIDRRGFEDHGDALVSSLNKVLSEGPSLIRKDGEILFFDLHPLNKVMLNHLNLSEIMKIADYHVDHLGRRYEADLSQGIDFTRSDYPVFIRDIKGLSDNEKWGRWSDANLHATIDIDFTDSLPQKFRLELKLHPLGPNINKPLKIKIGKIETVFILQDGAHEYSKEIDLGDEAASRISFLPYRAISPQDLNLSSDGRALGVGFISLKIVGI
jgi:phosphoglycerol transferase